MSARKLPQNELARAANEMLPLWRDVSQNANLAEGHRVQRWFGFVCICLALGLLSGCMRPRGDFERSRPSIIHDKINPEVGKARARIAGEPVSDFNLTDDEEELRNRVWRFLEAPHSKDWFFSVAAEIQRTRLAGATDGSFTIGRYYAHLRSTPFRSSRVRYQKVDGDISADIRGIPPVFAVICRVEKIDARRLALLGRHGGLSSAEQQNIVARNEENGQLISWFQRALSYRARSYDFALQKLVVETPHIEARQVDIRLSELDVYQDRTARGEFCGPGYPGGERRVGARLPSRLANQSSSQSVAGAGPLEPTILK